jgi:hypothetical protein
MARRPRGDNRAMPMFLRPFFLVLAGAACAAAAPAAGLPPVTVQERLLVLPKLPAGADVPMNLPEEGAVKMPFVAGGAPGVAGRINEAVWREMLDGATAPTAPGKTFTPRPDKLPHGTRSLRYDAGFLPSASPRLLSLFFSGEGCGAYCEDFATTRIFDLRDGRELSLGDLLTVDGFAAVGRRVDAERRRAYLKQVRELQALRKTARKGAKGEEDDDEDRRTLAEDCLKQVETQPSTPDRLVNEVFAIDGRGGLVLSLGRCSNHAMRALDDVGELTVAIPPADLKASLTPYGLAVAQQEGDAPAPPATFDRRELHGRLGGMPVTMKLEPLREGVETRGWYAYDKYRAPIELSVRQEGGEVRATERTESQGRFELRPAGGSLAGTWSDKDDRKQLAVILQ